MKGKNMKELPKISDAELEVMKLLWEKSPMTSSEAIDKLSKTHEWKSQTIKTLIERLVKKEAVGYDKDGRAYQYKPLVNRNEYASFESRTFLGKIFDGNLTSMFAHFVDNQNLSKEEYAKLKAILEKSEVE
jgi:BlaI family transcriptional regulator, penicillinase repressor